MTPRPEGPLADADIVDHPSFRAARRHFPGAEKSVYMDVSLRGLLGRPTRMAVDRFLEARMGGDLEKSEMFATVERGRAAFADMIGADPLEIAYTKNVSEGINLIATSMEWRPGDNVILCPELEHPNNVFPWHNVARRQGVEVRSVLPRDGHVPVERMVDAMDARTRLVTAPTVSFSPGFITDVRTLADACRQRDVFLLLDAAQSVGVLQTDVRELGADALTVATQKGLLAFYGMGFLFVRRAVAERMTPASLARFGVHFEDDAHETALADEGFAYARGARRFELGNYNYLGATAAEASMKMLLALDVRRIEAHVRGLARRLAAGLLELGLPVCGGPPGDHLGHIVAVGESGGGRHYTADDPAMNRLHAHLSAHGVRLSIRRGVLRFSLHLYNNGADVDRVLELAADWKKTGGSSGGE